MARLAPDHPSRARACNRRWTGAGAAFLGLECVDSSYDHRRVCNPRQRAAGYYCRNLGDCTQGSAITQADRRHRHRDSRRHCHRRSGSEGRTGACRKRALAWESVGAVCCCDGRDLLHNWSATTQLPWNLGVCGNSLHHCLCRPGRDCDDARGSPLAAALARNRNFCRPCARADADRAHGNELGAEVPPGIRGQPDGFG